MSVRTAALLSAGFLLLLTTGTLTNKERKSVSAERKSVPIVLSVENDLSNMPPESYSTFVVEEGVLLGALRRLEETQPGFTFTVTEDPNLGLFLESVNGVAGNDDEKTYWQLLSESSGEISWVNAGIGCYTPKAGEHIILRFTTWKE